MATEWFYEFDGEKIGPIPSVTLRQLAELGGISPQTKIWKSGMDTPVPASRVKELFSEKLPILDEADPSDTETTNSHRGPQEYRRRCNACGKVWHSLVAREEQIIQMQKSTSLMAVGSAMQGCGSCGTMGSGTSAQLQRNLDGQSSELHRLRSCPQCGSSDYNERIVAHAPPT